MRVLLIVAFLVVSTKTTVSQILDKSYEYMLSSANSPDAKLYRKTNTEITILWFNLIPMRYFFNENKEMYLYVTLDSKSSAEIDENVMHGSGLYQLAKIEHIGISPCRIYKRDKEYTGFYYQDNICYMATAYSIELVLDAIKVSIQTN